MTPDDPRHGTAQGRKVGCTEPCCVQAAYVYDKKRRLHTQRTGTGYLVPAWRSLRRLHALQALGWSVPQIAKWSGRDHRHFYFISHQENTNRAVFDDVRAAYEALSMTLPPATTHGQRISVSKAKAYAARNGYVPPLAWNDIDDPDEKPLTRRTPRPLKTDIDPVVIQRVLAGDRIPTTRAEKLEITARWEASGRTLKDLERLTGWRSDRYTVREAS